MSGYTPTTDEVREDYKLFAGDGEDRAKAHAEFDRFLAEHDAKVRAEEREKYDPAKDERLARYMALVTPLGYAAALDVVNSMTALMNVEARANEIADQARAEEREKAAQIAENSSEFEVYMDEDGHRSIRIREQGS